MSIDISQRVIAVQRQLDDSLLVPRKNLPAATVPLERCELTKQLTVDHGGGASSTLKGGHDNRCLGLLVTIHKSIDNGRRKAWLIDRYEHDSGCTLIDSR